jgi:hypothetical protein
MADVSIGFQHPLFFEVSSSRLLFIAYLQNIAHTGKACTIE